LTTVSGALSHGGMMGLTYNPSDQRMYMTWQRTGISETQNTPYGPILLDIPMIVVSSSSDGKTWTKPTNITLDGDQYLPQGGNLVLNGPTIIYDPLNNRLLVEYADYFPSCGCQEVFLNETYGPVFGQTWTPLSTSPVSYASSPLNVAFTPDLKSINGRLYMSYTSYSDKSIHVIQSTDGITWTNKADISGQTGYYAVINYNPVEATFHLLWVGTDSKYTINEVTSLDAVSWGGQIIFDGSGSQAVAETEDPPSLAFASNMNYLVMAYPL